VFFQSCQSGAFGRHGVDTHAGIVDPAGAGPALAVLVRTEADATGSRVGRHVSLVQRGTGLGGCDALAEGSIGDQRREVVGELLACHQHVGQRGRDGLEAILGVDVPGAEEGVEAFGLGEAGCGRGVAALEVGAEEAAEVAGEGGCGDEAPELQRLAARVAQDALVVALIPAVVRAEVAGLEPGLQLVVAAADPRFALGVAEAAVFVGVARALVAQLPADEQLAVAAHVEGAVLLAEGVVVVCKAVVTLLGCFDDAVVAVGDGSRAAGVRAARCRDRRRCCPRLVEEEEVGVGSSPSVPVVGTSGVVEVPVVLVLASGSLVAVPASPHARLARASEATEVRRERVGLSVNMGISSRWVTGSAGSRGRWRRGTQSGCRPRPRGSTRAWCGRCSRSGRSS
jgi:hypothetical protein